MTEEELYNKIAALKELYDALDSLIKSGYDGPFMGEDIRPLMLAYNKVKWGKQDEEHQAEV
jgi:hypothetical protein